MASKNLHYKLMDLFSSEYEIKFGKKPTLNRYREKWGFKDMIDSIGYDRAVEVLKFFFTTTRNNYTTNSLFNDFDTLDRALTERDEDRAKRARLIKETEQRVREWDATHESRSTSNQRSLRQ